MSDWVKHDGSRPTYQKPDGTIITMRFLGDGLRPQGQVSLQWPGWYWRLKDVRTGWFKTERRPVCDDPAYAPIIAYCFGGDDKGQAEAGRLAWLDAIARDPEGFVIPGEAKPKVSA